jgi:hypothetical protein
VKRKYDSREVRVSKGGLTQIERNKFIKSNQTWIRQMGVMSRPLSSPETCEAVGASNIAQFPEVPFEDGGFSWQVLEGWSQEI